MSPKAFPRLLWSKEEILQPLPASLNPLIMRAVFGDVDLGLPAAECAPKKCSNTQRRNEEEQEESDRDAGPNEKKAHQHEQEPETEE